MLKVLVAFMCGLAIGVMAGNEPHAELSASVATPTCSPMYELSTGVFGCLAGHAPGVGMVFFQPCTGPTIPVEGAKLSVTQFTCKDEATP